MNNSQLYLAKIIIAVYVQQLTESAKGQILNMRKKNMFKKSKNKENKVKSMDPK